jgi:hypothetical protein
MGEASSLNLPQIQSVLEEKSRFYFADWLAKTQEPEKHLEAASIKISEDLNQSVLKHCPSAEGHKLVVVSFVTKQVKILPQEAAPRHSEY